MSATLVKHGQQYASAVDNEGFVQHCQFLIGSQADVSGLPGTDKVMCGSLAYTADITLMYMLGQDNVWHKVGG